MTPPPTPMVMSKALPPSATLGVVGETFSAVKMASFFNEEFKGLTANNVVASAYNEVRAQEIDPTKTLTIGSGNITPVTINHAVNATVGEMIQAINAKSDQTNVRRNGLAKLA